MKLSRWRKAAGTYTIELVCWNCDGYVKVRLAQGIPMDGALVACPKCRVAGTTSRGSMYLGPAGKQGKPPPPAPEYPIPGEAKRRNPPRADPERRY